MKQYQSFLIIGGIVVVLLIILSGSMFITLEPGEKGIIFRKFSTGLDKDNIYDAGFHILAPWNTMYVYDVRENTQDESMDVLDKNGLSVQVDVTVRYYPLYEKIGYLHEKFGSNYREKLIIPEVRSSVRRVMGRFTAEEIYSTNRQKVEDNIIMETEKILEENNIKMQAMLIRSIILPPQIKEAIENKLKQEQEALAYRFKLEKEKSEAERKRIAAEGEARANEIINESLTENLLRMRGIETTLKLSQSENAKIVIIGGSGDGLPMILNN